MELWGGIEGTVNRVRDFYFSQLERNGHHSRVDDLERFAALGIKALRYPILWERTAPDGLESADWSWPDERLARLRELGVTPIVGLVHHGSGPRHTSLVDPAFAPQLARYARAVAERYPWVEDFTPVNEPLTTARFSGLYGVWYPHGRDVRTFKDTLLNQCRATVLAMREIRRVRPEARLVQTDDLGRYYGTPALQHQARFNNELRWLGWDLICGRVDRGHALWHWLTHECGAGEDELLWFADNPCPPDVLGVNHYITSERLIDERIGNYPERYHGGNGRERFADIETARSVATPTGGLQRLLVEAWQRYRIPLAITEAHIDATREDQLRWLAEFWHAALAAREEGADVRAVTVWALLGSYDWNCLLVECRGYYEPGAFDVRGPEPRPTAVAHLMRELSRGALPHHPVLSGPGWWRRPGRFYCPPVALPGGETVRPLPVGNNMAPILITGATGTLGSAIARLCERRGLNYRVLKRSEMDIADSASVEQAMARHEPWAVINAAGYVRVDEAERDVERCYRENVIGPEILAAVCARHGVSLVTFSSDLVFDGAREVPYLESDPTAPLNVYGRSKAESEVRVLARHPGSLVVRTSAFFGPWDRYNYVTLALEALAAGRPFAAASDMTVSPTYVPDLVNACLDLLIDRESGVWHLANGGALSWAQLAERAAYLARVDATALERRPAVELGLAARRPRYSALGSERSPVMPPLEDALERYLSERAVA